MKALFIGRFQPFHKGHLQIIKKASKEYKEIIIGIGSSQYDNTNENPFSSAERKQMIIKSLEEINIKNFRVVLIPDIHNYPKWVDHVTSIISDFDVVFSNNDLTRRLFTEKEYKVKETSIHKGDKYSGKEIRRRILKGDKWKDLVPKPVVRIIKDINGNKRLKKLAEQ